MMDFAFLILLAVFTLLTPKASEYFKINMLLTGKFSLFIGLHYLVVSAGVVDGPSTDIYRAMLDLGFAWIFWHSGSKKVNLVVFSTIGEYLSFVCIVMAVFHASNAFVQMDSMVYTRIMIGFQTLQLMASTWGTVDGLHDKSKLHNSGNSPNRRSHS